MTKPKRTRLSPEERRTQLLDVTQAVILEHGLNSFTMEVLAKAAGVSNPLVYKYFNTRLELLQNLLKREYLRFYEHLISELNKTNNFTEVVRIVVSVNFHEHSNGRIVPVLQKLSDVAVVLKDFEARANKKVARMLVETIRDKYDLSLEQARMVAKAASGASIAAAEYCKDTNADQEKCIADTMAFIFGGLEGFNKA